MADTIYQGDEGLEILANCGRDITGATGCIILAKLPSGVIKSWPATLKTVDGKTNFISYVTQAGDLAEAGSYILHAQFSLGDWKGKGKKGLLKIQPTFT
jgi:hypothetical protein